MKSKLNIILCVVVSILCSTVWVLADDYELLPNRLDEEQIELTNHVIEQTGDTNSRQMEEVIAEDTYGTSSWYISTEGVLHIGSGTLAEIEKDEDGNYYSPWIKYKNEVVRVEFDGPVVASRDMRSLWKDMDQIISFTNISYLDTSNTKSLFESFQGCKRLRSLDLTNWDTSEVSGITNMFRGCTDLEFLDVSNWNTKKITGIGGAFSLLGKLKSLDLSQWEISRVAYASYTFEGCSQLEALDLSGFDLVYYDMIPNTGFFEGTTSLKQLTVGPKFAFKYPSFAGAELPNVPNTGIYTGKWQNVGSGTIDHPTGTNILSSKKLMETYNGDTMADTYVWQTKQTKGEDIIVRYVNENCEALAEAIVLSGNIDEKYTSKPVEFEGYILTAMPDNAEGFFTSQSQTVTYIYKEVATPAANIEVRYLERNGPMIADIEILTGNIGETYVSEVKDIKGYSLIVTPENASGVFMSEPQTVTYEYKKTIELDPILVDPTEPEGSNESSISNDFENSENSSKQLNQPRDDYASKFSNSRATKKGKLPKTGMSQSIKSSVIGWVVMTLVGFLIYFFKQNV